MIVLELHELTKDGAQPLYIPAPSLQLWRPLPCNEGKGLGTRLITMNGDVIDVSESPEKIARMYTVAYDEALSDNEPSQGYFNAN